MIISYDTEADILVLKVREGALADEELLDNDVILGYDGNGKVVSVEILDASKKGLLNTLVEMAKARRILGYEPKTDMKIGLRRAYEFRENSYSLNNDSV
ncbi:MAG: DUF2283 domain-containing protein [Thermoproteota archaeon]